MQEIARLFVAVVALAGPPDQEALLSRLDELQSRAPTTTSEFAEMHAEIEDVAGQILRGFTSDPAFERAERALTVARGVIFAELDGHQRRLAEAELLVRVLRRGATMDDVDAAFGMAVTWEYEPGGRERAVSIYQDFGEIFAASDAVDVRDAGISFLGAARRLSLVGDTLELTGVDLDGRPIDLAASRGNVVLVKFWASWCAPCLAEIPALKALLAEHRDQGFEIVGVCVDENGDAARAAVTRFEMPWRSFAEPGVDWPRQAIPSRLGINGVPYGILLDRDGRVVALALRGPELTDAVSELVGDR